VIFEKSKPAYDDLGEPGWVKAFKLHSLLSESYTAVAYATVNQRRVTDRFGNVKDVTLGVRVAE